MRESALLGMRFWSCFLCDIISVTSIIARAVPLFLFLFFVSVRVSQSMMQADILRRRLSGYQRKTWLVSNTHEECVEVMLLLLLLHILVVMQVVLGLRRCLISIVMLFAIEDPHGSSRKSATIYPNNGCFSYKDEFGG